MRLAEQGVEQKPSTEIVKMEENQDPEDLVLAALKSEIKEEIKEETSDSLSEMDTSSSSVAVKIELEEK